MTLRRKINYPFIYLRTLFWVNKQRKRRGFKRIFKLPKNRNGLYLIRQTSCPIAKALNKNPTSNYVDTWVDGRAVSFGPIATMVDGKPQRLKRNIILLPKYVREYVRIKDLEIKYLEEITN